MRRILSMLVWLSFSALTQAQNLVVYYPFNGNANDESGNAINPTYIGSGVTLTTDRFGNANKAYNFDGLTNSYMRMPSDLLPTANRTVSLWFKAPDVNNRLTLLGYGGNSPAPPGTSFFMGLNLEGCGCYRTAGHFPGINTASHTYTSAPVNNWIHFAITINGNTIKIYINGILSTTAAGAFSSNTIVASKDFSLGVGVSSLGVAPYTDVNMGYFKGSMDEVRIYDNAMSDAQVKQLYQTELTGLVAYYPFNGNANDESGNGYNGVVSGASLTSDRFEQAGKAYNFTFNGSSSDKIQVAGTAGLNYTSGGFSISGWFRFSGTAGAGNNYPILSKHNCSEQSGYIVMLYNDKITFWLAGAGGYSYLSTPESYTDGQWHQVVAVYDGSNRYIFIDGQQKISDAFAYTVPNGANWALGGYNGCNGGFNGKVDELKVYSRGLTPAEILTQYKNESTGLVAYYPFNGNANDESGNGNNGTLINSPSFVNDRFLVQEKAIQMNASPARYVTVPNNASLQISNQLSISVWVKRNALNTNDEILNKGGDWNQPTCSYGLMFTNSVLNFKHRGGYHNIQAPQDLEWHHYAITTYQGSPDVKFYVDGKYVPTWNIEGPPINLNAASTAELTIGAMPTTYYSNNTMDDLKIYSRELSSAEIYATYSGLVAYYPFNGNANDESGNGNNGTLNGASFIYDRFNNTGKAVLFNGSSSVVTIKDTPLVRINPELTLSAWVKRTRFGIDMILEKGGDWTGSTTNYGLGLHEVNNNMFYFFFKGGWRGTAGVNDFQWHHYAVVARNGDADPQLYIDGELKPVQYRDGATTISMAVSAADLHIGAQVGTFSYFGANTIDEIKIFSRLLSAAEIQQSYRQEATGLVAFYPFNGNANDESGNGNNGIVNGATLTTDRFGNANKAYTFTNPNHISVLNSNMFGDEFTLSYWYKIGSYFGQRGVVSNVATPNGGFQQASDGTGFSYILGYSFVGGYNPNYFYANYTTQESLSQWHHLAVTYKKLGPSSSVSQLYIDGVLKQSDAHVMPITFTPNATFFIGQNHGGVNFQGDLDDIRIYNRNLSPNEIAQLADRPVLPNLLVYLPMNGHTKDKSGHHRDGTLYGGASLTADKYNNVNNALVITNAESGVIVTNSNQLDFTGQPFTISAWVKYSNVPALDFPVVSKHNCGIPNGYVLSINNNIPRFYLCSGGNWSIVSTTQPYNDDKWHHLVATYDGTGVQKLYVDGELKASASSVVYNSPAGSTAPVIIGDANGNCGSANYTGAVDEVKIYGAALDPALVAALYRQSRGSGQALQLAGNSKNQLLLSETVNPPPGVLTFTLEAWVKRKAATGRQWIFAGMDNSTMCWGFEDGKMIFGSPTGDQVLSNELSINDNKFHHVAVVCSPGSGGVIQVQFYSDGRNAGTFNISAVPMPVGTYAVGNRPGTTQSFDGLIDEVRIWAAALSLTTLRNWMNRKITPSHPNYDNMGYYFNFDEASLSKAYDLRQGVSCDFIDGGSTLWSGAPVGDTSVADFTNTVKTAMVPFAPNVQFTATGTNGNPDAISVYLVKDPPVSAEGATGTGGIDHYYGVQLIGGTSPAYTAVYQYGGSPLVTPLLEPGLALFRRNDNSMQQWNNCSAVLNTTAKTLTVTGQNTEYILGSTGFPLSVPEDGVQVIPVKLYPNPAGSRVTLRGVEQFERVQILDYSGKLIFEQLINKRPVVEVPLMGVKNGVYLLRFISQRKTQVMKLIVVQ
jgi:hypothetical protein